MLLIIEDPASKTSKHEKEVQIAKARSHAARVRHKARRRLYDPYAYVQCQLSTRENRSLAFYRERTSTEWAGWNDGYFWTSVAPRLAANYPALERSLIALGAGHEYLANRDLELQGFIISQARRCIAWFNKNYGQVPYPVLTTLCIILTELSSIIGDRTYQNAIKAAYELIDDDAVDEFGLKTLLRRHRNRRCQMFDPIPILRTAHVHLPERVNLRFNTLSQARESLEQVLNTLAFQAKAGIPLQRSLDHEWLIRFTRLKDKSDRVQWLTLKAARSMSIIQIETLFSETETVYDQYMDAYAEVEIASEASLSQSSDSVSGRFGVDGGLVSLTGWAARWCRDPSLKARLVALLRRSHRIEAHESSWIWADVIETMQEIEEKGIEPRPTSSSMVAEERRVRLRAAAFYYKLRLIRLDFLRSPYTGNLESVWIRHCDDDSIYVEDNVEELITEPEPDVVFGTDKISFLELDGSHYTFTTPDFYFVIPQC